MKAFNGKIIEQGFSAMFDRNCVNIVQGPLIIQHGKKWMGKPHRSDILGPTFGSLSSPSAAAKVQRVPVTPN